MNCLNYVDFNLTICLIKFEMVEFKWKFVLISTEKYVK